jgi:hypothetical protein
MVEATNNPAHREFFISRLQCDTHYFTGFGKHPHSSQKICNSSTDSTLLYGNFRHTGFSCDFIKKFPMIRRIIRRKRYTLRKRDLSGVRLPVASCDFPVMTALINSFFVYDCSGCRFFVVWLTMSSCPPPIYVAPSSTILGDRPDQLCCFSV